MCIQNYFVSQQHQNMTNVHDAESFNFIINTIDWFCGMKLVSQDTKQCRYGLSTSFGSRFGWKANTVRSRVFCNMTNHAWLLGYGFHGGMDSNQVGKAMVKALMWSPLSFHDFQILPSAWCDYPSQNLQKIHTADSLTTATINAEKNPLPTIKINEILWCWERMSHHFAVAMPQGNFSINQCCSGLKWHDVAGSNIPMNENQYTIHSKDNTSTQAACGNHYWEKMTIYRLCKIHTELNECKQGTWNDVHIRNSPTRFVHIKFSVVFICMYMIMKAIECSR